MDIKKITTLNTDANFLKLVAVITMLIDHIGLMFFPYEEIFRIIGRISFPIFSYCIMIGYYRTSNLKKYAFRLLIFGFICQGPYYLLVDDIFKLNIMFTLLLQLLVIYSLDKKKYYITFLLSMASFIPNISYSSTYLILMIILFFTKNNKVLLSTFIISLYSIYLLETTSFAKIPFYTILSLPFILININTNIKIPKHFFYIFYPVHIIILYVIKHYII